MKLVLIFGNTAVGKMTVGQELAKITDLKLFHNHMMIEPVLEVFGGWRGDVITRLREVIFEEYAASDGYGLIFTFMWAFDSQEDWDYVRHITGLFEKQGAEVCYVELVAPQSVRLERNASENRLKHKASKRDLEASAARLIRDDQRYRCESLPGEVPFEHFLRIENAKISPQEAAARIKERFGL